jgi:hypothetical protein
MQIDSATPKIHASLTSAIHDGNLRTSWSKRSAAGKTSETSHPVFHHDFGVTALTEYKQLF